MAIDFNKFSMDDLKKEIAECEAIQRNNPYATRSAWVKELRKIPSLLEDAQEAYENARRLGESLAFEVARGLVDVDYVRSLIEAESDVELPEQQMSMRELVDFASVNDIWINGDGRDGVIITFHKDGSINECYAYASIREIGPPRGHHVRVNLLTLEEAIVC